MAHQKGVVKIDGTLDDLTFYQSQDGNLVRTKGNLSKSRIDTDPSFLRTRENNAEFGNAAAAGKLLRDTVHNLSADSSDGRLISHLIKQMMLVKNFDTTSPRGSRTVGIGIAQAGAQDLLKDFNFNANAVLKSVLSSPFTVALADGTIDIPAFVPAKNVVFPGGATHVSIEAGFARIDFTSGKGELQLSSALNLPLDETSTDVKLVPAAVPSVTGTSFYLLKISFFQQVNGIEYSLQNGSFNSLSIVQVA